MIRDITIGQYYPVDSPIHRLDPRVKLAATFLFIIGIFCVDNFLGFGLAITDQGVYTAAFLGLRLILLVLGSSVMTLTTTPLELTDGIEKAMRPLKKIRVPVHEIAMMMSIALRFIPILLEETDKIMKAQQARGADFESGNILQRAKSMVPILVPLFISAFRRADDLATAMEARCYRGDVGRTRMKEMVYRVQDKIAYVVIFLGLAILIASRFVPSFPEILRAVGIL